MRGEVENLFKRFDREAENLRFHLEAMAKSAHAISILIRRAAEIPNLDEHAAGRLEAVKRTAIMIATISDAASKAQEQII